MTKRIIIAVAIILGCMLLIYGAFGLRVRAAIQQFKHMKQEVVVSDAPVRAESWQPFFTSVGNLTPVQGTDISNQIAGNVTGIYFQSGTEVRKGQLLVQLDDSSQRAQLIGLQAQVRLTKTNYQRAQELVKQHLIAKSDFDTAENNFRQAQSNLDNVQTTIDKLAIRAPFAGHIGIRNVNLGQYLPAGTAIASLQSLDPLYVQFALPEQDLAQLARGAHVEVTVDAYAGQIFDGEVNAINPNVDPNTHNVTVQATIHNPKHLLRAGLFANVRLFAGAPESVVTIPTSAVAYTLYGSSVFIVQQDGKNADGTPELKVTQQNVTTGQERDGRVAIIQGLKAGDVVVTAGQQKLQNGMQVEINNSVKLD
ncbi:MAG: efflux RND transporter periplasmic adaptor subunit [Gammaproteobacteria bacterium]